MKNSKKDVGSYYQDYSDKQEIQSIMENLAQKIDQRLEEKLAAVPRSTILF